MPEDETAGNTPAGDNEAPPEYLTTDRFKNFQAEVNRKLDQTSTALLSKIQEMTAAKTQPTPPPQEDDIADLMYSNPTGFVEKVVNTAVGKVSSVISERDKKAAALNSAVGEIAAQYPEALKSDSELTVRAREIANGYGEGALQSPELLKAAVYQAASELGLRPKSKRQPMSDDTFSLGGSNSANKGKHPKQGEELSDNTKLWMKAMGVKDKESVARVKKYSKQNLSVWGGFEDEE